MYSVSTNILKAVIITILLFTKGLIQVTAQPTAFIKENIVTLITQNDRGKINLNLNKELYAGLNQEKIKTKYGAWHIKRYRVAGYTSLVHPISFSASASVSTSGQLKGISNTADFTLSVTTVSDSLQRIRLSFHDLALNQVSLTLNFEGNPSIYGGGEQFSNYKLNGHKIPFFVEEQGIGRGDQPITFFANLAAGSGGHPFTTYLPVPVIFGSDGLFIFIENKEPSEIDLRKNGSIKLTARANSLSFLIGKFQDFATAVNYYNITYGQKSQLPEAAKGTILGLQGGSQKVLPRLKEAIEAGNPVSAIWIQDWCGKRVTKFGSQLWWNWRVDEGLYPNLKNLCDSLNNHNIAVWGYINPYFADGGALFTEFKEKGFFIKDSRGNDYKQNMPGFPFYTIDLTNPDARERMKKVIKENMLEKGLRGWMADFGEWLPLDAVLFDSSSAYEYHNRFPEEWAKLNKEAIQEAGLEKDIVFFCRSGFSESAQYAPLFWTGDQNVNFGKNDGIKSTVPALLSSSISGMPFNHSDIGGYTSNTFPIVRSIRKKNVLHKWSEMNAFTPVFRTHEGLVADKNHQVYSDNESVFHFSRMGRLHKALKPYFEILTKEYLQTGAPLLRPLNYQFGEKGKFIKHLNDAFMLGAGILVFPNIWKNRKYFTHELPPGKWITPYSDTWMEGKNKFKYRTGKPMIYFSESFYTLPQTRKTAKEITEILKRL